MNDSLERLRTDIMTRYPSIHAFCRQHENLKRSTVYAVLAGRYAGNLDEQIQHIRNEFEGQHLQAKRLPALEQISQILLKIRCRHCRPTSRRRCQRCRERAGYEADAVIALLKEQEGLCQDR